MKINDLFENTGFKDYASKVTTDSIDSMNIPKIRKFLQERNSYLSIAINNMATNNMIFRTVNSSSFLIQVDPTKEKRKSTGSPSFVNDLVSGILPEWQDYPKRTHSLMCGSNLSVLEAGEYNGNTYCVLHYHNPDIAISPSADFWYSIKKLNNVGYDVNSLNSLISDMLANLDTGNAGIQNIPFNEYYANYFSKLFGIHVEAGMMLYDIIAELVTPEGFRIVSYSEYDSNAAGTAELWFSMPAVLIRADIVKLIDWANL